MACLVAVIELLIFLTLFLLVLQGVVLLTFLLVLFAFALTAAFGGAFVGSGLGHAGWVLGLLDEADTFLAGLGGLIAGLVFGLLAPFILPPDQFSWEFATLISEGFWIGVLIAGFLGGLIGLAIGLYGMNGDGPYRPSGR